MEKHKIADGVYLFYESTEEHFKLNFSGKILYKYDSVKCIHENGEIRKGFIEHLNWDITKKILTTIKFMYKNNKYFVSENLKIIPYCRLVIFEKVIVVTTE